MLDHRYRDEEWTFEVPVAAPADTRLAGLERELVSLMGHINAANARFLVLLEEFDRLGGWKEHGLTGSAHWLNWRCGIGMEAAREKVRVARALPGVPAIRAHFEKGEISYSKVRAMTRIATPENEGILLNIALHGTAHHVETLVRKWRQAKRLEELETAEARHAARSLHYRNDENGCLRIEIVLPPEQGAVVLEAIQAAMDSLEEEVETCGDVSAETSAQADEPDDRVSAATPGPWSGAVVDAGGSPRYTAEALRYANSRVNDAQDVSAETSGDDQPPRPSAAQRRDAALVYLSGGWLGGKTAARSGGDRYVVNVHVDAEALAHGAAGRSELEHGPSLAAETVRRLCCDGGIVTQLEDDDGNPLSIGRTSRAIPPAMRRALKSRDGGCRFPGCTRTRWLDGHHIEHWANGGETSLDNLVQLCHHHHRLVHEGGFGVSRDASGELRFTTPAGAVIPEAPGTDGLRRPLDNALEAFQRKRGITIDHATADTRWEGERMDYGLAGALLGDAEERAGMSP